MLTQLQNSARLLSLFVLPGQRRASTVYDLLSTQNNLGQQSLYLNLGYWDGVNSYDAACERLAEELGEAAGLGRSHRLLDVGFGFADQDMFWARKYEPEQIVGLNITESQVLVARQRVREHGLADKIDLRIGSATQMPLEAECFDRVTALETAHHYNTREAFLAEAYRVLRPGGRLAIADIIPLDDVSFTWRSSLAWAMARRFWQMPMANFHPWSVYRRKLERAGFVDIQVKSIRDQVYAPMARHYRQRLEDPEVTRRLNGAIRFLWKRSVADERAFEPMDYVIVTASKPD